MLEINKRQAEYYDRPSGTAGNSITQLWRIIRHRLSTISTEIGIMDAVYDQHRQWLGDLSNKSVLDLGCGRGNKLSLEIAQGSKEYLAIDLSQTAIDLYREKLHPQNLPHARAEVIDFLSPDFKRKFDVIYAYSVMHHFEHFDLFLQKLAGHLHPGGTIITFDPLNTSLASRILRGLYRPFQSDKDWEWPFTRASFDEIQTHLNIVELQGMLGYSKCALPLSVVSPSVARRIGTNLHKRDWQEATELGPALWRCLHLIMLLTTK